MLNLAIIPLNLQVFLNKLEKSGVRFLKGGVEEGMGEGHLTLQANKGVVMD